MKIGVWAGAGWIIGVLRAVFWCSFVLIGGAGSPEAALNMISYSNGIDPAIFVSDGDPEDTDFNPLGIRVVFDLVDANGDWTAEGVILATTTPPPNGVATLVVTDTEIINVTGDQIIAAMIHVNHFFDPIVSVTQQYTAHIDGAFDTIGNGIFGNYSLENVAELNGAVPIDTFFFASGDGPAPETFNETSLPLHLDTVIRQTEHFIFYMDTLDNVIRLFDSATILPSSSDPVPTLGPVQLFVVALALMAALGLAILRLRVAR